MSIVVARAPGRVSLAGGGTDLPGYYERRGGAVVSLAIPRCAYAQVTPRARGLELVSLDQGAREVVSEDRYSRRMRFPFLAEEFVTFQKAVAWHFGFERGRLAVACDLPAGGGLGSSAAVCAALVQATSAALGERLDRDRVAEIAARIEMTVLRRPCGKQDPYASAFGGLNLIEFSRDGAVKVSPISMRPEMRAELERHLMLFTGSARRNSAGPLGELARRATTDRQTMAALDELKATAYEVRTALERGDMTGLGRLLDRGWRAKQRLHSQVTSPEIDRAYLLATEAGATGGKLAGAGLAGSLLFVCPPESQDLVRRVLATQGWRSRAVTIDDVGVSLCEPTEREASV